MSKKKRYLRSYIIILILVLFSLYLFQKYNNKIDTEIVQYGKFEDKIDVKGVIIKDEAAYTALSDGQTEYYYKEGEKVTKGSYIADLKNSNSVEQINSQIKQIDEVLQKRQNQDQIVISDGSKDSDTYYTYNNTELQNLKAKLQSSLNTGKLPYYSTKSGFVTYYFDGLENVLKFDDVLNLTPKKIEELTAKNSSTYKNTSVSSGDNMLKVINNFSYYVTCVIDKSKAKQFEEGSYVNLRFGKNENTISARLDKIVSDGDKSLLILWLDNYFYQVYNKRIVDVSLISNEYNGIIMKKEALFKKDGQTGVYVRDGSNIIKFYPVEVLSSNDEDCIVNSGGTAAETGRGTIIIKDKYYYTVKAFDKVVLDKDKVYEGQIVN